MFQTKFKWLNMNCDIDDDGNRFRIFTPHPFPLKKDQGKENVATAGLRDNSSFWTQKRKSRLRADSIKPLHFFLHKLKVY